MEAHEEGAQVALALRVPGFLAYTPQTQTVITCDRTVRVGGVTAKFRISLDLYATRRVKSWTSVRQGETGRGAESPSRVATGLGCFSSSSTKNATRQPPSGCTAYSPGNLPELKGCQSDKAGLRSTPTRNTGSGTESPRTKSGLRDLYTYGGIAEVIYDREGENEGLGSGSKARIPQKTVWGGRGDSTGSDEGDQLDVCVEVVCLQTSVPWQLLRHVQVRTGIEDRPEQQRALVYECGPSSGPEPSVSRWRGVLVPRISLKTYGLLRGGALNASVIFDLPSEVLRVASDSLLSLTDDMRHLLESCQMSADTLLLTSDGGSVPAHLAILKARSSLLSTCKILNQTSCDIGIMVDGRSPAARSAGMSNIGEQKQLKKDSHDDVRTKATFENTLQNDRINLSSDSSSNSESDEDGVSDASVRRPMSNKKIVSQGLKKISPAPTRHACLSSPSQLTSSERLALFRKTDKTPTSSAARSPLARINKHPSSPSKRPSKSQNLNSGIKKATRDLNECFIDCNETSDVSLTSTLTLRTNDSVFPGDDTTVIDIENDLKENFNNLNIQVNSKISDDKKPVHMPPNNKSNKILIKVNMSTTVTKQFLEWIYTGESRQLSALCRPLLAAGRRHGVPELAAAAERHLVAGLSTSTAAATLLLAHTYQAWHLMQEALDFVRDHAEEVTQTEDWERVVNKCPELALKLTRMMTSSH